MNMDFPFHFDDSGRTAAAYEDKHVHNLIEAVLFTSPGERINRPDFGSGLLQLVFAPMSDELATTTQFLVQGALQQWLGELIELSNVEVETEDTTLRVTVSYTLRKTGEPQTAQFAREV